MKIDETYLTPIFIQVAQWLEEEILKDHIRGGEEMTGIFTDVVMIHRGRLSGRKTGAL